MPQPSKTAAIILAAGTSSRMGAEHNKLLLPLHNRPVLVHVIEAALASQVRPIILVLGHQASLVKTEIQPVLQANKNEITVVENSAYLAGQSTSLKAGLNVLLSQNNRQGLEQVIFLLGDQPLITSQLIDDLIVLKEASGKRIALPLYQGQRGNPVIFSLALASELRQTNGDEGGRSVLKRHPDDIATLDLAEKIMNVDVDTWEVYQQIQAVWEKQDVGETRDG
jgi:molybdenum cofactor cytidylyltransferase